MSRVDPGKQDAGKWTVFTEVKQQGEKDRHEFLPSGNQESLVTLQWAGRGQTKGWLEGEAHRCLRHLDYNGEWPRAILGQEVSPSKCETSIRSTWERDMRQAWALQSDPISNSLWVEETEGQGAVRITVRWGIHFQDMTGWEEQKSQVEESRGSWFFTKIPLLTKRRRVFDLIRDLTKSSMAGSFPIGLRCKQLCWIGWGK